MSNLLSTAINAALNQDWQKAISVNQNLLKENKEDINSMNRLAHAYIQIGKLDEARKLYKKILVIDKYNTIALKKLERLSTLPKVKTGKSTAYQRLAAPLLSPSLFIEEPGKTKTVNLKNTAPAGILSHLNPGEAVIFFPKRHSIEIRTQNKDYIGALPDDFAFRLLRFMKAGYDYEVFVKSATKNSVSIFIREIKRAKRFKSQPSFLAASSVQTHAWAANDHKTGDVTDDNDDNSLGHEDMDEV